MAYYNYKRVRALIPAQFREEFEARWLEETGREFEGTADYDGDLWVMTAEYIEALQTKINELRTGR